MLKGTPARKPIVQGLRDASFISKLDGVSPIIGATKFQGVARNADVPSFSNSSRNKMTKITDGGLDGFTMIKVTTPSKQGDFLDCPKVSPAFSIKIVCIVGGGIETSG